MFFDLSQPLIPKEPKRKAVPIRKRRDMGPWRLLTLSGGDSVPSVEAITALNVEPRALTIKQQAETVVVMTIQFVTLLLDFEVNTTLKKVIAKPPRSALINASC